MLLGEKGGGDWGRRVGGDWGRRVGDRGGVLFSRKYYLHAMFIYTNLVNNLECHFLGGC